jgi:hypothetical protein
VKRPNPRVIETDESDTAVLLRLPNTHQSFRLTSAAILLWNTWKRKDFEAGVQAVVKKYGVDEARAREDAQKLLGDLESAGLLL